MSDKELIKEEIEKLYKHYLNAQEFDSGYNTALDNILQFIDSLPEEPANEDLEEEIKRYINEEVIVTRENVVISKHHEFHNFYVENIVDVASHFAEWQKHQMMKDAVEAIVSQVPCSNEIIFRNPASVHWCYLPSEMNKLDVKKGDKVKIIIIKE